MTKYRKILGVAVAGALGALWAAQAISAPLTVYSNDFDGGLVLAGGTTGGLLGAGTIVGVPGGFAGLAPGPNGAFVGSMFQNTSVTTATTLSLANLPVHNVVDVNFLLAILDSWDSTNGAASPDLFQVTIDGNMVINNTFANASGTITQPVGLELSIPSFPIAASNLGFGPHFDRAYDASTDGALMIGHNSSTLTVTFQATGRGWQGNIDESWGMDNLNVVVDTLIDPSPVPEPGTLAILGFGLAGLGFARRRKKLAA